MKHIQVTNVSPEELVNLITEGIKIQLQQYSVFAANKSEGLNNPHLTRKETARFFNVSLNCINDWCKKGILKSYKVGNRTYFKRDECLQVLFNNSNAA
ncbi:MAG: helix-turn-helix domain-containing protein [Bacteroidia bacterium]